MICSLDGHIAPQIAKQIIAAVNPASRQLLIVLKSSGLHWTPRKRAQTTKLATLATTLS
jgi:hypothetical protein